MPSFNPILVEIYAALFGCTTLVQTSDSKGMVYQIYPPELQLNKANISDTETPFLDLHLSISNGFVSSNKFDKRDDF